MLLSPPAQILEPTLTHLFQMLQPKCKQTKPKKPHEMPPYEQCD